MIRCAATVVLAITLHPMLAGAQDTVITVNVPSADVYRGATTASPVIGHVSNGTVLPVVRNLGSWVRVPWPGAEDGVAYLHVSMGIICPVGAAAPVARPAPRSSSAPAPPTITTPPPTRAPANERVVPRSQPNVRPISHIVGLGGLFGSTSRFGASARTWRNKHVGIQMAFTRDTMTSDVAADRVTSWQVEPGFVYALFDRVSDYVWIRPYVGTALNFGHQTLEAAAPLAFGPTSDNSVGLRVFGGGELTYAGMTQFGLSVDVGYSHVPTSFPGFEARPLSVSISGHWYIK